MTTSTKRFPPRGRDLFRKYNMAKAIRTARDEGLEIGGIEVAPNGTIRVLTKATTEQASGNELESWMAKRDARQA